MNRAGPFPSFREKGILLVWALRAGVTKAILVNPFLF